MRSSLLALAVVAVFSGQAAAQSAGNWDGFYAGVHGGFAGAYFNNDIPLFAGPTGEAGSFIGGGQIGYNWRADGFVLGAEVDASLLHLEGSSVFGTFEEDFMATARLRAGAVVDEAVLVYVTGGIAGTHKTGQFPGLSEGDAFVAGLTVGGGIEAMLGESWSARIEYLYVSVPDDRVRSGGFPIVGGSDNHIVRAGINLHF